MFWWIFIFLVCFLLFLVLFLHGAAAPGGPVALVI